MRKLILISFIMFLLPSAGWSDDFDDAGQVGRDVGSQINQKTGTSAGINDTLAKPLTSEGTKLNPLIDNVYQCPTDNRAYSDLPTCTSNCSTACMSGVNARIQFPSSESFLEVNIVPQSGGDIRVYIQQDTDFDGTFNQSYFISQIASGVCGNGIISCDPGTWNNCRYFEWSSTGTTSNITLNEVFQTSDGVLPLGGCYAINASADPTHSRTSLVFGDINGVLRSIGGGIVGAIQSTDPHCAVTQVDIDQDNMRVTYYGQLVGSTTPPGSPPDGSPNPEQYYKHSAQMEADALTEITTQMGNPDSMTYLHNSSPGTQDSINYYNCIITRDITFTGAPSAPISGSIQNSSIVNSSGTPCAVYPIAGYITLPPNHKASQAWITNVSYEDCLQVTINNATVYMSPAWSACSDTTLTSLSPMQPLSPSLIRSGTNTIIAYANICGPTGSVNVEYLIETVYETSGMTISGGCSPPADCKLYSEKICDEIGAKCVNTYAGFIPTKFKPYPFCRTISSSYDIYTACASGDRITTSSNASGEVTDVAAGTDLWWYISRTYKCPATATPQDLGDSLQRTQSLQNSLTANDTSTEITYTDNINGSPVSGSIQVHSQPDYDDCEMVCKVRAAATSSDANPTGQQGEYLRDIDTAQDSFKACNLVSGSWHCATESGETVVDDCQCLNDFTDAVTSMGYLKEASKDMICNQQ